ncbi:ABC transporter substrate-binding protein [Halobacillus salinus]|uniref:Probable sugar-binding periplasmic protein n=1 Tax=Halobacillus salinus TaxID=192814 RepID=A0A4Z0GV98_9BACI|nr:ABC transporter substrate-binding protein [Halobacillus salinus]TGB01456.1 carbohydrate ABC transporter substrate-binding protein [Halobacillus salinus]
MKRKSFYVLFVALLLIVLGACSNSSSSDDGGESASGDGKIELFSWWTAGGEADGLDALIEQFKEEHPDIEVENAAVAGGAGTNAKAVLANRMQGGDPPSTFQVHGGDELLAGWVAADKMQPLNDLYEENNWSEVFPQELIDMVSKDDNIYAVPVDIHRGNVVFFNSKVFEDNGIEAPTTWDEFLDVADQLESNGVTPLALGDKNVWPATMIFENILLANLGADDFDKLWDGEIGFDDERVVQSAETFKEVLNYVNDDHSARAWQDASQLVSDGEAAMNIMGDWANGYYLSQDLKPNEDYGWAATPGSEGTFMVITDTFGLPKDINNEDQVKEFLTVLGSKEGQDAFNPMKGSIPARTDTDLSNYGEYATDTIKDFKDASLVASLAHGSAAPEQVVTQVNQAVNIFVTQKDVDQFTTSLQDAVDAGTE